MNSYANLGGKPKSLALPADDVLELHASRLLLLIKYCGVKNRKINGLTKLAKLDFFVRYPGFFYEISEYLKKECERKYQSVESRMVRHHYGPWDKRYYHVIGFLESRELVKVTKIKGAYDFTLTDTGSMKALSLAKNEAFWEIVDHMKVVKKLLGRKNGSQLKNLIYEVFKDEVKERRIGDSI